VLGSCLMI